MLSHSAPFFLGGALPSIQHQPGGKQWPHHQEFLTPPCGAYDLLRSQLPGLKHRGTGRQTGGISDWVTWIWGGAHPPTSSWTWLVPPPNRVSASSTLQAPRGPTLLTSGGSALPRSGHNPGLTESYGYGVGGHCPHIPPSITSTSLSQEILEALSCWDQAPGRIWDRLSCVALGQGLCFPCMRDQCRALPSHGKS